MKNLKNKKYSILSGFLKYSFIILIFSIFILPVFVGASGVEITGAIKNPLGDNMTTLPSFIEAIIQAVLIIGVPILVLAIIYAGFLFVKAQGNSEELTKAKRTLLYTIIGGALLLGAFVIAKAIGTTVNDIIQGA